MKLPNHLLTDSDGGLYDTRKGYTTIRKNYALSHSEIKTVADLKATLRAGERTFPGGYPLYFICADGGVLSFESVRENLREVMSAIRNRDDAQWHVMNCAINWETTDLVCDHSGEPIESAYGE